MSSSVLLLATIGGMISFLSTSFGTLLSALSWKAAGFSKFKFSVDFALGLMLSAVAFSLVGPAVEQSSARSGMLGVSLLGFAVGGLLIYFIKALIERKQQAVTRASSSQLVLAIALIVHNFPEGLASGAASAGLELAAATPILTSVSIQNIPEGLLMVLCLKAMGWSNARSLVGGFASGLVELIGGVVAGFALSWTANALPMILMVAGGAMLTSVVIELKEKGNPWLRLRKLEFVLGLLAVPALNMILN